MEKDGRECNRKNFLGRYLFDYFLVLIVGGIVF